MTPEEQIACLTAEIERLRGLFRLDGEQHANHIRKLTNIHEIRITKYIEALRTARQERDEARRCAETLIERAYRLASEAETVCGLFGGDKSVDALRAVLSDYLDKRAAIDSEGTE